MKTQDINFGAIHDPFLKKFLIKQNKYLSKKPFYQRKTLLLFLKEIEGFKKNIKSFNEKIRSKSQKKMEQQFNRLLTQFFSEAEKFEREFDDFIIIESLKKYFRISFKKYLYSSKLVERGSKKPRGYPGDSQIIESIYDNQPKSRGIGYYFDKAFLDYNYAQAVRDRKDFMKSYLMRYLKTPNKNVTVLNLACGGCRELREMLDGSYKIQSKASFTLIDKDPVTLRFARNKLRAHMKKINFDFICDDVLSYLMNVDSKLRKLGAFDLIYSIGLADYLPDSILGPMIKNSVLRLKEKGIFIIAHKNTKIVKSPISDWACDWKFLPRNENDLAKLIRMYCKGIKLTRQIVTGKKNLMFYFILTKHQK